jgi:hypothetical protein
VQPSSTFSAMHPELTLRTSNERNGSTQSVERRRRTRGRVRWHVQFLQDSQTRGFVTTTQNLSCGGFYCLSPVPLRAGQLGSCVLEIPTHHANTNLRLQCSVRILRVEPPNEDGVCGVGCQIEDYSLFSNINRIEVGKHRS